MINDDWPYLTYFGKVILKYFVYFVTIVRDILSHYLNSNNFTYSKMDFLNIF